MDNLKIMEAYEYAKVKHEGQTRKDGTPYINHPVQVSKMVKKYFGDDPRIEDYVIAAYLHDTVEDTDVTIEEIKSLFGDFVAHLVSGVTSDKKLQHEMGKTEYLCYKMLNMDDTVLNLKLCDRLSNIIDLVNAPENFQTKYISETITILDYVQSNREVNNIQKNIIDEIILTINNLENNNILIKSKKEKYFNNYN